MSLDDCDAFMICKLSCAECSNACSPVGDSGGVGMLTGDMTGDTAAWTGDTGDLTWAVGAGDECPVLLDICGELCTYNTTSIFNN